VLVSVISCGAMMSAKAAVIFVSATNLDPNQIYKDGTSWGRAYPSISSALSLASPGTAIWVAAGDYRMPSINYPLPDNVDIYGGFNGTESQIGDRKLTVDKIPVNKTILREPLYPSGFLFALKGTTNTFNGLSFIANGGITQDGGTLTVTSSTFVRDVYAPYVTAFGGNGILSYDNAILNVNYSQFTSRLANRGGGIAGRNARSVNVANSTFNNNGAIGGGVAAGGAIEINGDTQSEAQYGNPMIFGPKQATSLTITNSVFGNNYAYGDGGAIYVANAGDVTITGSGLSNNAASTYGGAVSVANSGNVTITSTSLGNNISNSSGAATSVANSGNVTITGAAFANNVSYSHGGAAYIANSVATAGNVAISNTSFTNNRSDYPGGATSVENIAGKLTITGSTFTGNSSVWSHGGAVFVTNAVGAEITGSTFGAKDLNGNPNVNEINSAYGVGGAISANFIGNPLTISGNFFYGNQAIAGGAIYTSGQALGTVISVTSCLFKGNSASYGGAILNTSEITSGTYKTVTLSITKNTFSSNLGYQGPVIWYDGTEKAVNGNDLTKHAFNNGDATNIYNSLLADNPGNSLRPTDIFASPTILKF